MRSAGEKNWFLIFFNSEQRCQIFLCTTYQKREKIYQTNPKYTKWPWNLPNGRKTARITKNVPALSISTSSKKQNWDFGLKIKHLAALTARLWEQWKTDSLKKILNFTFETKILVVTKIKKIAAWHLFHFQTLVHLG
jgi:hypothetical protein